MTINFRPTIQFLCYRNFATRGLKNHIKYRHKHFQVMPTCGLTSHDNTLAKISDVCPRKKSHPDSKGKPPEILYGTIYEWLYL
jgi:hypothetical protein